MPNQLEDSLNADEHVVTIYSDDRSMKVMFSRIGAMVQLSDGGDPPCYATVADVYVSNDDTVNIAGTFGDTDLNQIYETTRDWLSNRKKPA